MKLIQSMNEKIVLSVVGNRTGGMKIEAFLLLTLDDGRQVKVRETDSNIHLSMEPASFYNEKEKGLISQVLDHEDVYLADPYYSQCYALLSWKMREDSAKPQRPDSFSMSDYGINFADFDVKLQACYSEQFKLSRDVSEIVLRRSIF